MEVKIAGVSLYYIINWFLSTAFWMGVGILLRVRKSKKDNKQRFYKWSIVYHLWVRSNQCIFNLERF